jgi:hypothetical protein
VTTYRHLSSIFVTPRTAPWCLAAISDLLPYMEPFELRGILTLSWDASGMERGLLGDPTSKGTVPPLWVYHSG